MSMLEKMARRLALDALERVQPGTYTSVVDGVGLYQMLDGNYQVGEYLGAGYDDAPGIDYDTAREAMVAMMAEQAGALVVVPEDAPMDSHLVQIAQMLVDSADVPTDASDVADGSAIVGTVKRALEYLDAARDDNRIKRERIKQLEKLNESLQDEIERLNAAVDGARRAGDDARQMYLAAQQEIGALTAKLDEAKRSIRRGADEAVNCQARYEAMSEALSMAMDKLAGVGK